MGADRSDIYAASVCLRLSLVYNGTIYVTIETIVDIGEYNDRGGHSPFREWYDKLNAEAARKVTTRVGLGNFSNGNSVAAGVYECRRKKKKRNEYGFDTRF